MKPLHKNLYVAGQITADQFPEFAAAGIKVIINNRPDNEEAGQLDHTTARELAEQHGMIYHYLPMANGQPMPPTLVEDFRNIVDQSGDKILAHCRSGMRTSFIWALGQIAAGRITPDQAITAAQSAGVPLHNARAALEQVQP